MQKLYIVRLHAEDRAACLALIKELKDSSNKVRRANILLQADADGPHWTDQDIADAFLCIRQTVENVRKRLVTVLSELKKRIGDKYTSTRNCASGLFMTDDNDLQKIRQE